VEIQRRSLAASLSGVTCPEARVRSATLPSWVGSMASIAVVRTRDPAQEPAKYVRPCDDAPPIPSPHENYVSIDDIVSLPFSANSKATKHLAKCCLRISNDQWPMSMSHRFKLTAAKQCVAKKRMRIQHQLRHTVFVNNDHPFLPGHLKAA